MEYALADMISIGREVGGDKDNPCGGALQDFQVLGREARSTVSRSGGVETKVIDDSEKLSKFVVNRDVWKEIGEQISGKLYGGVTKKERKRWDYRTYLRCLSEGRPCWEQTQLGSGA